MIENVQQLKQFFVDSKFARVAVPASVRKAWMLNDETVTLKGLVRDVEFSNAGGGVWFAELVALKERG